MDTQDRVQEENSYQLEGKKTVPKKFPQKNSQPRKLLKHDNKNRTMPSLFGGMIIGQNIYPHKAQAPPKPQKVQLLTQMSQEWKKHPGLPVFIKPSDLNDLESINSNDDMDGRVMRSDGSPVQSMANLDIENEMKKEEAPTAKFAISSLASNEK